MKIETHYYASYRGVAPMKVSFGKHMAKLVWKLPWNDGLYREDALELINRWNRVAQLSSEFLYN